MSKRSMTLAILWGVASFGLGMSISVVALMVGVHAGNAVEAAGNISLAGLITFGLAGLVASLVPMFWDPRPRAPVEMTRDDMGREVPVVPKHYKNPLSTLK